MLKCIERALGFLLLSLILLLAGCDDSEEINPINSMYLYAPRVTGIWITAEDYPQLLGYWGVPPNPLALQSMFTYPNPFNPRTTIGFAIPESIHVKVWVVRALGPMETEEDLVPLFKAGYVKPAGAPLDVLVDRELPAGSHQVEWDATPYPDGFYCCYLAAGDKWFDSRFIILWRGHSGEPFDVLFGGQPWIKFD